MARSANVVTSKVVGVEAAAAVWVVRGGDSNEIAAQVERKGAVGIGFSNVIDLAAVRTREALSEQLEIDQPGNGTPSTVGQLFRFANEIREGDIVLTPDKATKRIHVGRCAGRYRLDSSTFGETYPHVLPIQYVSAVERARFPVTVRNTLGSVLTVFRADAALPYLQDVLGGSVLPPISPPDPKELLVDGGLWADEIEGQAKGQILEALDEIEHHDFQLFVAGLLEALGYKARVGQKGKDGGVDVLAFPDVFGLATPRIKVQTKNQRTTAGVQEVGYLNGILGSGERGLFVCTGGFSADAKNAPFVRDGRVSLVDGASVLDLLLENYEQMPARAKALLPLRRVYVPEQPALA